MDELKKTIEALGKAFEEFKAENDKRLNEITAKGHADPLLAEKVERINKDIAQIAALKKQLEDLEKTVSRGGLGGGAGFGQSDAKAEHAKAFKKWLKTGINSGLRELEIRAEMSTLSDPEGGFLTSDPVVGAMREVLSLKSRMRELANVIQLSSDEYKTLVDQLGETSEDVTEKQSRSTTATPTFVEVSILTKEMSAKPKVTQRMLDDTAFPTEAFIGKFLGRTFAAREGLWFWKGNGVEQAKGINAYSKIANASYSWGKVGYIASGEVAAFTDADKLYELQHALKAEYRIGAKWLMNDNTLLHIRKFKDGDGNYIWRPGLAEGAPETLLGKPVAIDDYVDDIGAGKYPIWWADWVEAYTILDRIDIRMLRDPYSSKPYVEFYTTKQVGGGIIMYEAIKALKVGAS